VIADESSRLRGTTGERLEAPQARARFDGKHNGT